MKKHFQWMAAFLLCAALTNCNGQSQTGNAARNNEAVGGGFENSEFTYQGLPKDIDATDTSAGWKQEAQKILVKGIVYQADGKTPAPGVLLYYYHTNSEGRYLHKPTEAGSMPPNAQGQTHGYLRGWVKTNAAGAYFIFTSRPGTYPTRDEPAHIHMTVKEPNGIKEYYIDDVVFEDDPLLTAAKRNRLENRGGSGILTMMNKDGLQTADRNIVLGLNIPNHPGAAANKE